MNIELKKGLAIIFISILYTVSLWGLVFFVLAINQSFDFFILFLLAAILLVPIFLAERFWCKRLGLSWLVVRLVTPPFGGFIFLITAIIINPMVMLGGLLMIFFFGIFALFQFGLVLFSILCTVVYRKIRANRKSID